MRIMVDLETLGNKPGCAIVAIGAVWFGGGKIFSSFYRRVDAESCEAAGLKIEGATVMWWLRQADEARLEIAKSGVPIGDALREFSEWIGEAECEVWGNGAAFDNVILAADYDCMGMERPWKFWNDRCYRTTKSLHPEGAMEREGTHHNALHDAESQARHLMRILELSGKEGGGSDVL